MNTETTTAYLGLFDHLKTLLYSSEFQSRHRQRLTDFTRKRCLTFVIVILFLINLVKRALQDELDEFFKVLDGAAIAVRLVTKSAFSQARQKLKSEAFIELNQTQVRYFYAHFETATWQGFRVVAVDGSMSDLPNTDEIRAHFGVWHPVAGGNCPKARISQMFDVLNKITLDAIITPKDVGERAAAALHFEQLIGGHLVLLDRGYPAFWLFALILSKGGHFCARMPLDGWTMVEEFLASGKKEQSVTLFPCYEARQECHERCLPTAPLTVRLLRIELLNGEVAVLLTSLIDQKRYPYAGIVGLYLKRWPVEEDYKAMKSHIEVENWSGMSVLAIYQDFQAKVFTKNLTAILAHPVQKVVEQESQEKKYIYRVNMTHAFSKMKDTIVLLFQRVDILSLMNRFWHLLLKTIEPVRLGRSYPREKRVKPRRFSMSYKPIR